jgi:hypothetical protein
MGGDWDHQALLVGNLYSDDGIVTTANPSWNANIFISSAVAAQGIETGGGGGATPADIWGDTDTYPVGSKADDLANAGAAGNPWSAPLASNKVVGTFGWLVQKLLTVVKFLGLK